MAFKPITLNTPAADAAHILAEDDAAIYESIIGGDCVLPIGSLMKATVTSNNNVRIADGVVLVGGHVGRIVKGDYEDMTITNGQSGQKRNDIIAARFIAGSNGGADSYGLVVIKGTPGTSAADPVVVKGDLYAGDKQRDYPLWRVCLDGLSITKVEQMYEIGTTNKDLADRVTELNGKSYELIEFSNGFAKKYNDGTFESDRDITFKSGELSFSITNGIGYARFTNMGIGIKATDIISITGTAQSTGICWLSSPIPTENGEAINGYVAQIGSDNKPAVTLRIHVTGKWK